MVTGRKKQSFLTLAHSTISCSAPRPLQTGPKLTSRSPGWQAPHTSLGALRVRFTQARSHQVIRMLDLNGPLPAVVDSPISVPSTHPPSLVSPLSLPRPS